MYCLRYWARYVRKGEVKSGGIKIGNESASLILLLDSPFREMNLIKSKINLVIIINLSNLKEMGSSYTWSAPVTKLANQGLESP